MQCDTAGSTLDPGSWGWGTPGCAVPARPCWQQALGSRVGREGNLIPGCQIPQDFQTLQGPQTLQEPCQTQEKVLAPGEGTGADLAKPPRLSFARAAGSVPGSSREEGHGHTPVFQGVCHGLNVDTASMAYKCFSQVWR